jgi:pyruvate,water dikinase
MRLRTALRLPRVLGPMALRLIGSLVAPDWSRRRAERHLERLASGVADPRSAPTQRPAPTSAHSGTAAATAQSALARLEAAWRDGFPTMVPHALPRITAGVICQRAIGRLTRDLPDAADASLIVSRGVAHNVTTDMNRALWAIAQEIRGMPPLRAMVAASDAAGLARAVLDDRVPPAIERSLATFLERYGARGLAEIDLGRVRWSENPAPVLQALQAYVRADGSAPPEASSTSAGLDTTRRIAEWQHALRVRRGGFTRAWLLTFCISRARALGGLREAPKFAIMRRLAQVRGALREAGEALAREGLLDRGEDIFFLHVSELRTIAAATGGAWHTLVQERRERYEQEMARTQIPLVLLSDGSALFGVAGDSEDDGLRGTPVSPGVAEGVVRVLDHPTQETLTPGEILVCRGTDPSWTPLFLAAAGLVTEVGGVMSHGAIVARECGLPAIVGVPEATTRLKSGQRVQIDGGSGEIRVIAE